MGEKDKEKEDKLELLNTYTKGFLELEQAIVSLEKAGLELSRTGDGEVTQLLFSLIRTARSVSGYILESRLKPLDEELEGHRNIMSTRNEMAG